MITSHLRKSFVCLFPKNSASNLLESPSSWLLRHFLFSTATASVIFDSRNFQESHRHALLFKEYGFSDTQLKRMLQYKRTLPSNLEKCVAPKISIFKDFGFSNSQIAAILSRHPGILRHSASKKLYPSVSLLWDLFGDHDKIVSLLKRTEWFFSTDLRQNLVPNIEFLKSRGLSMERILLLLSTCPRTLLSVPMTLRSAVEKVETLGADASSKMFIYCVMAAVSMSNKVWEEKLQTFIDLGFSESDTINVFLRVPIVFSISRKKIERNVEFILATNRYTLPSIRQFPGSLWASLEKRIKPRVLVFQMLEEKNLISEWPSLPVLYLFTTKRFYERFMKPYPDVFARIMPSSSRGKEEKCLSNEETAMR